MAREGGWRMAKEWGGIAREAKHCQSENHLKLCRSVMLLTCLFSSPFKMQNHPHTISKQPLF